MTIQELLDKPEKWLKLPCHALGGAVDKHNEFVDSMSCNAVKWTLLGAYQKCYGYVSRQYKNLVAAIPPHKRLFGQSLSNFNGLPDTTYEDIIQLVKDAGI